MTAHIHPHPGLLNGSTPDPSTPQGRDKQTTVNQIVSTLVDLKTELALGDWAEDHPLKAKILQLSELVNTLGQEARGERQIFQELAPQLYQATEEETLLTTAVTGLQQALDLDRVLVLRFEDPARGRVIAEAVAVEYTPALGEMLPGVAFGAERAELFGSRQVVAFSDRTGLTPRQTQVLNRLQIEASLSVPIQVEGQVWGLLVIHQCLSTRQWQDGEVILLQQVAQALALQLQTLSHRQQTQQQRDRGQAITRLVDRIRFATGVEEVNKACTQGLRQLLSADRVGIYRFNPDWSGGFVAESVGEGWIALLEEQQNNPSLLRNVSECSAKDLARAEGLVGQTAPDTYLQRTQGGRYRQGELFRVTPDIYSEGFSECYLDLLESYQARAYVIAAVYKGQQLWGLLAIYQNAGPRPWQSDEIALVVQIATQLGSMIQQLEFIEQLEQKSQELAQAAERDRFLLSLGEQLRQAVGDEAALLQIVAQELRTLVHCDRVGIYRFNPDWSGQFVGEAVATGWTSLLEEQKRNQALLDNISECSAKDLAGGRGLYAGADTHLHRSQGGSFTRGELYRVCPDIYAAGFTPCYIRVLESYQARSYVVVAIFLDQKLWGLLAMYQNSGPRDWSEAEINLGLQVANQMAQVLEQTRYIQQLQDQSQQLTEAANRDQGLVKVIREIRQTLDIDTLFANAAREVRLLLGLDRAALYQFKQDWSGEFVAESVAGSWNKLLGRQVKDTYLEDNQGGRYINGETHVINDIYGAGFDPCHVELLESFQARAYVILPVFAGQTLWGLFAAYQNSGPRQWEDSEVNLLVQVAEQFGIALNQAQYLDQVQSQSQQLAEAAERERRAKENLQQEALALLRAIEPSFRGDLTVRAPLTEDEVGTIADAYNTTVQSLRELVRQVQIASTRVSQTSSTSTASVSDLATQAQYQTEQIVKALDQLQRIGQSVQAVATAAQRVEQAVQQANQTVQTGDIAMNRTVDGILEIRETVSETAKKIKRLGESTQKISKVVSLIENFATQTNLLALNAAIEATRAGEYGRGFAVVADEVRSLAYQSANATTEIERLVQEIQTETGEVAEAMELGIAQVVQGTDRVSETRRSLTEIVAATEQISQLLQGITQATVEQTHQSQQLTEAMNDVAAIANRTSEDSARISGSFQELLATSEELQASVSRFKVD